MDEFTQLHAAIESHSISRVAELLADGFDPNATRSDYREWTPLKSAVEEMSEGGPLEILLLLLRHGADVNPRVADDASALIVASTYGLRDAIVALLAAGADPNIRDDEGATALGLCEIAGDDELISILRTCGATETNN